MVSHDVDLADPRLVQSLDRAAELRDKLVEPLEIGELGSAALLVAELDERLAQQVVRPDVLGLSAEKSFELGRCTLDLRVGEKRPGELQSQLARGWEKVQALPQRRDGFAVVLGACENDAFV